jgi:hypothetical protein
MRRFLFGIVGVLLVAGGIDLQTSQSAGAPAVQTAAVKPALPSNDEQRQLLDRYCVTCHNERLKTGGLALDLIDPRDVNAHAEVLEKVLRKLRSGQMPPEGRPRPDQRTLTTFMSALESALDRASGSNLNPGSLPVHRLNRLEYANVIRDMLSLEINPQELLPTDDSAFGFDNNAEALSVSPALMARYMSAATKISRLALGSRDNRQAIQVYKPASFGRQDARMGEDLPFGTYGGLAVRHAFPLDGDYDFRIRLQRGGNVADNEYVIEVRVDHALVKQFRIGGEFKNMTRDGEGGGPALPEEDVVARRLADYRQNIDNDLKLRVPLKAGVRLIAVTFVDIAPAAPEGAVLPPPSIRNSQGNNGGLSPGVDSLEIAGPFGGRTPRDTPSRRRIFVCEPTNPRDEEPCAKTIITTLARRAFRRPVTASDVEPLFQTYRAARAEGDFERGIERALETLLTMPSVLLRIEAPPAGARSGQIHRISDIELASRLSFFLWRSAPDDELLDAAARGSLHEPRVFEQQVRRVLADARAARWMTDFVGQWLIIRNLRSVEPDPLMFPDFDDTLRDAMGRETELFFESQVRDDRSIGELLTADYTYLNERLAGHYRVPGIFGSHFRRVRLTDERRHGLLGQASVLTVTSYAHRTSVVLRGKWVLETLLGSPPPPPPPNVPPLKENDGKSAPASLRDRMEQHRRNPVCATCHTRMDPLGFALENFDATGRWRETDEGAPINAAITLDGAKIDGPSDFRAALAKHGDEFVRAVAEKVMTYALGRGLQYYDGPTVRQVLREAANDNYKWSALILAIVRSKPFQMTRVPDVDTARPATVAQGH